MTNPTDTTPAPAETPAVETPAAPRRRWLPIVIGAGAGILVLGLGIGGFALADALDDGDDRDDDRVPVSVESPVTGGDPTGALGRDDVVDPDDQVTDEELARVTDAALGAAGGGTVTDIDRSDDPGEAWEVEVRLDNGDEMDVELAADYSVLRTDLDPRD